MKTRGQCYYFCYDTHSFNNPCVHILTAGIHVLAFQGTICTLIKADIILLSLVSNSALSLYGSSLQSNLRDSQHVCVVESYWRGTRGTKEKFSAWPQGTEVPAAGHGTQLRFLIHDELPSLWTSLPFPSFFVFFFPQSILSLVTTGYCKSKRRISPLGVNASMMRFYRSFFFSFSFFEKKSIAGPIGLHLMAFLHASLNCRKKWVVSCTLNGRSVY